jgi:hypothetical protein
MQEDLLSENRLCVRFDDYYKHFLTLMGYKNLEYQNILSNKEKIDFSSKEEIIYCNLIKEIYQLLNLKENDQINDIRSKYPNFDNYFFERFSNFLNVTDKYFCYNEEKTNLLKLLYNYTKNNLEKFLKRDMGLAEFIYNFCEPYISKTKQRFVYKEGIITNNIKCKYCGSQYDNLKFTNCPKCGGTI